MWRSWLCVARNRTHLIARTMESLSLAIFFSLIYRDQHIDQVGIFNINGLYTSIACMLSFQCIFSVVLTNSNDLPIFLRDHWNGMYRTGVYVICKSLAEVPSTVFFPLLMSFFPFYMSGFINGKELLLLCVILFLLAASSASFGNFVTSITSSIGEAMVLIPILASPLLMTSGFFISLRSMPVYIQWFQLISWYKYANEALSINQWKDVKHIECNFSNSTCSKDGRAILDVKDFDPNNLLLAITALGIITLSYILLEWTALSFRAWRKK